MKIKLLLLPFIISCSDLSREKEVNNTSIREVKLPTASVPKDTFPVKVNSEVNSIGKDKSINAGLNEKLIGVWKINSYFLRSMSALSEEDAAKFIGDSIFISKNEIAIPFSSDKCNFKICKSNAVPIDNEVKSAFKLEGTTVTEYSCKCNNYDEFFYIITEDQMYYETDGAVFRSQKVK